MQHKEGMLFLIGTFGTKDVYINNHTRNRRQVQSNQITTKLMRECILRASRGTGSGEENGRHSEAPVKHIIVSSSPSRRKHCRRRSGPRSLPPPPRFLRYCVGFSPSQILFHSRKFTPEAHKFVM